ncbi:MAG: carboxylating nicotinate-nucleotide diphosphorylase [Planctomycetia bacterium]|nr:carboxylating nicotinate-nucleotide diphosphorylase [Planctomycetia bacterium]
MNKDFQQIEWTPAVEDDCRQLVRLAVREDLDRLHDWTTVSLVPHDAQGGAAVVAREEGVIAGLRACEVAIQEAGARLTWQPVLAEGASVSRGTVVAEISGSSRDLLVCERLVLNILCHLSGIATLTRRFVEAVAPHLVGIYDTRKTTPGWRRLEKYAVRCGGGHNHRTGLFDAVLIKDNHLPAAGLTPAAAVRRAQEFLAANVPEERRRTMLVEVEVDTLAQLEEVLPTGPDIVLLDNMSPEQLRAAVARRNAIAPAVQFEASGGITLATIGQIAATGIERISVGALTHSAVALDCGLDWH